MNSPADARPVAVALRADVLPNFLVIRNGKVRLADSTINLSPTFCTQLLAAANWYVCIHDGHDFILTYDKVLSIGPS
jgi:hypothetical protein